MSSPFTHIQRALQSVQHADRARFHMPGHMGASEALCINTLSGNHSPIIGSELYPYDVTELDEMDVINEPESCLKASQDDWAHALDTQATFYLTGGSTQGLQAALLATCGPDSTVIIGRNAHQSVVHGLVLTGATPCWVLPEENAPFGTWGAITPESIQRALEQASCPIDAVIITSPTYEGVGSDVTSIAALCRQYKTLLIVDEAHGALWPYSDQLPPSAIRCGADVVIQSLHKTAGALTPAALAHLPRYSRISHNIFQRALNTLQTTSPSWPLLANIEACGAFLNKHSGHQHLESLIANIKAFRKTLPKGVNAYDTVYQDPLALLLCFDSPVTGKDMAVNFEQDHAIAFESYSDHAVLYKLGIGTTPKHLQQLNHALHHWSQHQHDSRPKNQKKTRPHYNGFHLPHMACTPRQAYFAPHKRVLPEQAVGQISAQTLMTCPPGIPLLFPGEIIPEQIVSFLPQNLLIMDRV